YVGTGSARGADCGGEVVCLVVEGGGCGEDGCAGESSGAYDAAESGCGGIESEPACSGGVQPVSGDADDGDGGEGGTGGGEGDDDGDWAAGAVVVGGGSPWRGGGGAGGSVL